MLLKSRSRKRPHDVDPQRRYILELNLRIAYWLVPPIWIPRQVAIMNSVAFRSNRSDNRRKANPHDYVCMLLAGLGPRSFYLQARPVMCGSMAFERDQGSDGGGK